MKQQTLSGFEKHMKTTRRAQFPADMALIMPWRDLEGVVEPVYPKVNELGGRPPIELQKMLRMYFLQLWFNLSDPAVEESLYDAVSMRLHQPQDEERPVVWREVGNDQLPLCGGIPIALSSKFADEVAVMAGSSEHP